MPLKGVECLFGSFYETVVDLLIYNIVKFDHEVNSLIFFLMYHWRKWIRVGIQYIGSRYTNFESPIRILILLFKVETQ